MKAKGQRLNARVADNQPSAFNLQHCFCFLDRAIPGQLVAQDPTDELRAVEETASAPAFMR